MRLGFILGFIYLVTLGFESDSSQVFSFLLIKNITRLFRYIIVLDIILLLQIEDRIYTWI